MVEVHMSVLVQTMREPLQVKRSANNKCSKQSQGCHTDRVEMSVPFSGTLRRSAGLISAISKQLRQVNLKPVKHIIVKFDPFHENAVSIRDFLFYISAPRVQETNPVCRFKTEIVCDRSEPTVSFALGNGEIVHLKSNKLTTLEILQLYNKHITPLVPVEEPAIARTKLDKKGSKKRK
ncbi:hypothetical protein J437_LFUL007295 [Ladona fulva]|uniref:Large ribosomal subunit protein mL53 n=1 Tax=Ladona fulva TaxID=123851 RepID=A0A8K0K5Y0_LADFU|nr:hypothetical protein J437_LFUL007295 [Ladona fulva]